MSLTIWLLVLLIASCACVIAYCWMRTATKEYFDE